MLNSVYTKSSLDLRLLQEKDFWNSLRILISLIEVFSIWEARIKVKFVDLQLIYEIRILMKSNFTLIYLVSLSKLISHISLRFQWSHPWRMLKTSKLLLRWLQQNPLYVLFSLVRDDQMYRSRWRFSTQKYEVGTNSHRIF